MAAAVIAVLWGSETDVADAASSEPCDCANTGDAPISAAKAIALTAAPTPTVRINFIAMVCISRNAPSRQHLKRHDVEKRGPSPQRDCARLRTSSLGSASSLATSAT